MTNSAQLRVVAEARATLGCAESPPRSNDGWCVNLLQSSTGAFNAPWCASAITSWWKRAGIDVSRIGTASTAALVSNGRALGALVFSPIMGCAVVWNPGANGHAEIFIEWIDRARGLARTIGGNTGDAVREHFRDVRGAFYVAPPELLAEPAPVFRTVYWWEDPKATPTRHGLYALIASREKAVRLWVARHGNPGHVRRGKLSVMVDGKLRARFTFWTGQRKRSKDFTVKAERDANMRAIAATRPGHTLRPRSRRVRVT